MEVKSEPGFNSDCKMCRLAEQFDWSKTSLGDLASWTPAMRVMVNTTLHASSPISILWGPELVQIYNDAYSNIIGNKHPGAFGAPAKECWRENWQEIGPLLQMVLKEGKSFQLEDKQSNIYHHGNTTDHRFTFSFGPVFNDSKNIEGVLVSVTDVTSNIKYEEPSEEYLQTLVDERTRQLLLRNEELKSSEERYHKMVEEVQDYAIILLDKHGIIQNWNRGAEKIKQYMESEIVGKPFQVFYLPEDRAGNLPEKLIGEAIHSGRAIHEGWRLRKDRTKFWGSVTLTALHNEKNEIIGFSKVTRDLTERKYAEEQLTNYTLKLEKQNEALRKSEERYQKMVREVQDYAIILLNEKGEIENWNAGAEKIKGYREEDVIGKNFEIFYTPADRKRKFPEMLLEKARQNGKAEYEGWRLRKDGTTFWGSIVLTALHDSDNTIIGFSKVTRDLTERKHAEDKMRAYMLELESQNRELEQFAYVASHDLQEPLRKIQTFIDIIEHNFNDAVMVKKYFEKINSSAQRMTELIKSVLNYSRLSTEGREKENIDLNTVVDNMRTEFELLIHEKNARIEHDPLPVINAIAFQVHQLFANLIGNALKFTKNDPVVRISSKMVTKPGIVHAPQNLADGNYIEVSVSDNGIGFNQQYERVIFSMFQRLHGKKEYAGTGIGLALCKKIMENHNGYITVESELSKGSVFYVYFPAE
jgi:PAS domain S-box-containing protein